MISATFATARAERKSISARSACWPFAFEEARVELLAQRVVRRLHLHDEPALEARAQPLLQPLDLLAARGRAASTICFPAE